MCQVRFQPLDDFAGTARLGLVERGIDSGELHIPMRRSGVGWHQQATEVFGLRAVPVALGPNRKVKRTYSADGKRHGPDRGHLASIAEMCRYQGLADDFFGEDCPFTETAKRQVIGNGVPLAMGRAIAKAVKRALSA